MSTTAWIGASPKRNEDVRLLLGHGRFLDDIILPRLLHAAIVRSPHAHARIIGIEAARALALSGVVGVFTAADLLELSAGVPPSLPFTNLRACVRPALAAGIVRHVGEPVAIVVCENAYDLEDATAAVFVEYAPLPAIVDAARAACRDARAIHVDWPNNVASESRRVVGNVDDALARVHVVVEERLRYGRCTGTPLEPRGVVAAWDEATELLTVWSSTQTIHRVRNAVAEALGLSAEQVRVFAPDTGGGFGTKAQVYPEELLVPTLARRLTRPVKWVETRAEHFVSACHDRDQTHAVTAGFARDGTLVAVDDRFAKDYGAYPMQDDAVTLNTVNHLPGPYRVPAYRSVAANVVTNKTPAAAYRGAGRPEAVFVMERVMDLAARRLGLDPAELRRRNLVRADEMPYRPGLTYRDGVPIAYDPGDFPKVFERALALVEYERFRKEQTTRATGSRRLGIGLACYLHGSAVGPSEGANVRVDPSGMVFVFVGVPSQGQGHATTLAQICADELGVSFDTVIVKSGDTSAVPYGLGPTASRIAALAGTAVARAAREVRTKVALVAAAAFECRPEDVRVVDGRVHVVGYPDRNLTLQHVARVAMTSRTLAETSGPGLNASCYFFPKTVTWGFGTQAAVVAVDVDTCVIDVLRYVAVHDCGRAIHPVIIKGQLHGGVAQGLGAALSEALVYDDNGQLTTATLMEYGMPRADRVPPIAVELVEHPSAINELGIKGVGESGVIAPAAVVANAVEDALADLGVVIRDVPITPSKLFSLLR